MLGPSLAPSIVAPKEKKGGQQPPTYWELLGWDWEPSQAHGVEPWTWEPLSYLRVAGRRWLSCLDPAESRLASSQTERWKASQGWMAEEEDCWAGDRGPSFFLHLPKICSFF